MEKTEPQKNTIVHACNDCVELINAADIAFMHAMAGHSVMPIIRTREPISQD